MQTDNTLLSLTPAQLRKAAQIKEQIDALTDELTSILTGTESSSLNPQPLPPKQGRRMSAAGRARIAAAARARWARLRAEKGTGGLSSTASSSTSPGAKPKRTMSPAARRKIAEAQKARWSKIRAAR